jgi:hypothetical protein
MRDTVRIPDADMRKGKRRGEGEEKGEQRFHEDLCSNAR